LPLDAKERVKQIKKAIRGDTAYQPYTEHKLMENYSIGYDELMDFPYERYLECSKMISLEAKEEKKRQERKENEIDRKT